MRKGETTRITILGHAAELASQVGLSGLTIGALADDLELSKSGLFAHFRSKEALQIQVLEHASQSFVDQVVTPALKTSRGEPRIRSLFDRWLAWDRDRTFPGGCVFVAAATELDDRPGPVRDRLVDLQRQWLEVLIISFRKGIEAGQFDPQSDAEQFAQDLYGIMLAYHHQSRLMDDPRAEERARRAFERLLADLKAQPQLP
jgi:AcrR family transcriptional regulator